MQIEFLTNINDYKRKHSSNALINALNERLINTAFVEKLPISDRLPLKKSLLLETQTKWLLT